MANYVLEGPKWGDASITWSFAGSTYAADSRAPFSSAIGGEYQSAVQWAVEQWASVSGLTFTQVADSPSLAGSADIRIGFGDLNTATTGVIGQTFLRYDGATTLVPDQVVRLEDPASFALVQDGSGTFTYANTTATLQQVALHEIGHALGLGHASDPTAVMFASVGANNQYLNQTDIDGIQSLYGAPQAQAPAPMPATPAPASDPYVFVLQFSEDAWQGDAQFVVSLDGQQLGGAQTVTAAHAAGQHQAFTFEGSFAGPGVHDLAVSFINDAWGGSSDTDRNLFVDAISYNGASVAGGSASLFSNGTAHFAVGASPQGAALADDDLGTRLDGYPAYG